MIVCLLLITLAGSFARCTALMNGAPVGACSDLLPAHNSIKPQQGNSPYSITAHSLGDKISVMISSPTGESFKGFMLQARSASKKENFIPGEFTTSPISKGVDCEGLKQSTLTHVNNDTKTQVSTEWSGTFDEDIIFRATVVKEYSTFWTNIDSDPVTVKKRVIVEESEDSDTHVCAESEFCIGLPKMCVEKGKCKILLKMKPKTSDTVGFSLSGILDKNEYMAMGISEDDRMGDDFVTECLRVGPDEVKLRKSWNNAKSNEETTDISEHGERSLINGATVCSWVEPRILEFKGRKYDLTNKAYILLANGEVAKGEILSYHHEDKLSTSGPIDIFPSESSDTKEDGDKQMTEEHDAKRTTEPTSESSTSSSETNRCLKMNLNLFWLSLFVVFCARGRNPIQ